MTVALISHPDCALHDMGWGHPESPARLDAIQDALAEAHLDIALQHHEAPLATREELTRVHFPRYVDYLSSLCPTQDLIFLDSDTAMNRHSCRAAQRAAGAMVLGVDLVTRREADRAFCAVRPPGHHAERGRAMGFCLFNNVAVGAAHALEAHGYARVAILDFDVHHGNGTEDIFAGDERVLFCSTFQHPFYPFTGAGSTHGNVVDVPLPGGTGSAGFRQAITEHWLPALEAFRPELVLVSAGFDAHVQDEMSGLALTENDYAWVSERIREVAERDAGGRIVSTLEGGYDLGALGRSVVAHIDVLLGNGSRARRAG
jgi:acetoin utilization deacetylase AcuC-like enzyme